MRRLTRPLGIAGLTVLTVAVCVATAPAASATSWTPRNPTPVAVTGAVTTPASYNSTELAALPQTTWPDTRSGHGTHTVTGVLLEQLVDTSGPVLPAGAKNGLLRVAVTVSGAGHQSSAVALGELDPSFGNHPAVLALRADGHPLAGGPALVFPADHGSSRTIDRVTHISVAVSTAVAPVPAPAAGSIEVVDGRHVRTLTATQLARLRPTSLTVSFLSGTAAQTDTEAGPTLAGVLRAAGICTGPTTVVVAVGDDGYAATVTPAEAHAGRRPLLLSTAENGVPLAQPRLVTDGDVKGGRYVSGVVELVVTG
jgi:hypothetical protein